MSARVAIGRALARQQVPGAHQPPTTPIPHDVIRLVHHEAENGADLSVSGTPTTAPVGNISFIPEGPIDSSTLKIGAHVNYNFVDVDLNGSPLSQAEVNNTRNSSTWNVTLDAKDVLGRTSSCEWTYSYSSCDHQPEDLPARHQPERGTWKNSTEFFLTCLGYTVGLGAVWRFPYLCYENGGGAFLIPYLITSVFVGVPLYGLELCIGQYSSLGPNKAFVKMAPLFQGLGYAVLIVAALTSIYYNVIIAWAIFYFFASFAKDLSWKYCGHVYNTIGCFSSFEEADCRKQNESLTYWNSTCVPVYDVCRYNYNLCAGVDAAVDPTSSSCNRTLQSAWNSTHCLNITAFQAEDQRFLYVPLKNAYNRISATEEFFSRFMLAKSEGWHEYGGIKWDLALCSALAWLLVALILCKGVKSSGKVVYFTSLFPYVVLFIFGIKGSTLPGSYEGFIFFAKPKWESLLQPKVWITAASMNFYALGPAFGSLVTFASYNKFNHNCLRDALFIGVADFCTAFFSGSVVFAIIGHTAHELGLPVGDVIQSGEGLAFIAYPDAISQLPVSPLWGILFFSMMIACGLDSEFTMVETLLTALLDEFPNLRKRKALVACVGSLIGFIFGLSMCTPGGIYLFKLFDYYSAGWAVLILGMLEALFVVYVFGYGRFIRNVKEMISKIYPVELYWRLTWSFSVPALVLAVLVFTLVNYEPLHVDGKAYPFWADGIGWAMGLAPLVAIVVMACRQLIKASSQPGSIWARVLRPRASWRPAKPLHLHESSPNLAFGEGVEENSANFMRIPRPAMD